MSLLKLLTAKLVDSGYEVISAVDGKSGLNMAKKEKPDLILLDIKLPIMDGMTMLSLLRKEEWGKSAKVIILTNFEPDEKTIGDAVSDRPAYYFIKSNIELKDLLQKIQGLLGG